MALFFSFNIKNTFLPKNLETVQTLNQFFAQV